MLIPNIWKNKKCSKPPTRFIRPCDHSSIQSLFQSAILDSLSPKKTETVGVLHLTKYPWRKPQTAWTYRLPAPSCHHLHCSGNYDQWLRNHERYHACLSNFACCQLRSETYLAPNNIDPEHCFVEENLPIPIWKGPQRRFSWFSCLRQPYPYDPPVSDGRTTWLGPRAGKNSSNLLQLNLFLLLFDTFCLQNERQEKRRSFDFWGLLAVLPRIWMANALRRWKGNNCSWSILNLPAPSLDLALGGAAYWALHSTCPTGPSCWVI